MDDQNLNVKPGDEIVIVVPEGTDEDEIVIDLDELGIDVENLDGDINIVIEVEGQDDDLLEDVFDEDGNPIEANEWYFDDDPYKIVYYEYPDWDEED